MQTLQERLGADSQRLVDYWLFTLMGCLVTPETTWIFGLGMGYLPSMRVPSDWPIY
ncbi:hypothetical protein [Acaryochloris marina]|uniref:hypothetical protein n=1 Tax=Acaryochloris marina TaxID=155978 RepID=UPI0021C38F24|nr:hypothetical protein [Acaryochloris marina]